MIAAASTGDVKVVQCLVEAGADPNMWVDMDGCYMSPLLAAADTADKESFEYLLPLVIDQEEIDSAKKVLQKKIAAKKHRGHLG